jgi:hypothetical protein
MPVDGAAPRDLEPAVNDNQNPALRHATNSIVIAGERLIGPGIDEKVVGLAMLAAGAAHLGRLMPAEALREHLGRLAEELDGAEARP